MSLRSPGIAVTTVERSILLSAPGRASFVDVVMIGAIGRGPFQSAFSEWTLAPPDR